MRSDTHVVGAVAIQSGILLSANIQNPDLIVGSLVVSSGGALFPDLDHAGSYISNRYPLLGWIGLLFKHRGFTHTLLFWLLMTLGLFFGYHVGIENTWWTSNPLVYPGIAFFVTGGLSHLFLDSMTPSGTPFLWPLSTKRYSLNICKTGSILERIIELGFIILSAVVLAQLYGYTVPELINQLLSKIN
ncbi:MAG: metal-dependent hydrolase [bacterium]